jgi:hypothetical protein
MGVETTKELATWFKISGSLEEHSIVSFALIFYFMSTHSISMNWFQPIEFLTTTYNDGSDIGFTPMHHSIVDDRWNIMFNFEGKFVCHIPIRFMHPNVKFSLSYKCNLQIFCYHFCNNGLMLLHVSNRDDFASQNWSTEPSLCFPKQYFCGWVCYTCVIYSQCGPCFFCHFMNSVLSKIIDATFSLCGRMNNVFPVNNYPHNVVCSTGSNCIMLSVLLVPTA